MAVYLTVPLAPVLWSSARWEVQVAVAEVVEPLAGPLWPVEVVHDSAPVAVLWEWEVDCALAGTYQHN